jgi:Tol biopolymer transport system component
MTQAGVLLGTAAYMAPEQARGEAVDRRADIWAFGIVLMEMLTGERVYAGKTVSDTLAGVLAREPNWEGLPEDLPSSIRNLLERCLEKEARDRLQAIGEARLRLERYLEDPDAEAETVGGEGVSEGPSATSKLPWAVAGVAILVALVLGILSLQLFNRANQPGPLTRTTLLPPEGHDWALGGIRPGRVALSPDGRQLAYSAIAEGETEPLLWVHALHSPVGRPLQNTEGAGYPFWSPDGRHVAFYAEGKLKKIAVAGGPPVSLCDASNGKSGSWGRQGVIVYSPTANSQIFRVPAAGGDCVAVTELNEETGDNSHRHAFFLPDGERFLYVARSSGTASENMLRVGSVDGSVDLDLLTTPGNAAYASGRLLFIREGTLMAQPFDPDRLELSGEAVPVVERVLEVSGAALYVFWVSETGELVYQTGQSTNNSQVIWSDRSGAEIGTLGEPVEQIDISVADDGTRAVTSVSREDGGTDLWLYDTGRNLLSRFSFADGDNFLGAWSPDGDRIAFSSNRESTRYDLYIKEVGGTGGAELLLASEESTFPYSWSPDGELILFTEFLEGGRGSAIRAVAAEGGGEPLTLVESEYGPRQPTVSPNGRWLAYSANESGQRQVYVTTFPQPDRRWQVSVDGGLQPRWTRNGAEIVFLAADRQSLMAAEVSSEGDTFTVGSVRKLFEANLRLDTGRDWDVTADGERFLLNSAPQQGRVSALHFVTNWPAILEDQ